MPWHPVGHGRPSQTNGLQYFTVNVLERQVAWIAGTLPCCHAHLLLVSIQLRYQNRVTLDVCCLEISEPMLRSSSPLPTDGFNAARHHFGRSPPVGCPRWCRTPLCSSAHWAYWSPLRLADGPGGSRRAGTAAKHISANDFDSGN